MIFGVPCGSPSVRSGSPRKAYETLDSAERRQSADRHGRGSDQEPRRVDRRECLSAPANDCPQSPVFSPTVNAMGSGTPGAVSEQNAILNTSPILKNRARDGTKSEDRAFNCPRQERDKAPQREIGQPNAARPVPGTRATVCRSQPRDSPGGKPDLARKTGRQDYAMW